MIEKRIEYEVKTNLFFTYIATTHLILSKVHLLQEVLRQKERFVDILECNKHFFIKNY